MFAVVNYIIENPMSLFHKVLIIAVLVTPKTIDGCAMTDPATIPGFSTEPVTTAPAIAMTAMTSTSTTTSSSTSTTTTPTTTVATTAVTTPTKCTWSAVNMGGSLNDMANGAESVGCDTPLTASNMCMMISPSSGFVMDLCMDTDRISFSGSFGTLIFGARINDGFFLNCNADGSINLVIVNPVTNELRVSQDQVTNLVVTCLPEL